MYTTTCRLPVPGTTVIVPRCILLLNPTDMTSCTRVAHGVLGVYEVPGTRARVVVGAGTDSHERKYTRVRRNFMLL
jgi:hypothetical protein